MPRAIRWKKGEQPSACEAPSLASQARPRSQFLCLLVILNERSEGALAVPFFSLALAHYRSIKLRRRVAQRQLCWNGTEDQQERHLQTCFWTPSASWKRLYSAFDTPFFQTVVSNLRFSRQLAKCQITFGACQGQSYLDFGQRVQRGSRLKLLGKSYRSVHDHLRTMPGLRVLKRLSFSRSHRVRRRSKNSR